MERLFQSYQYGEAGRQILDFFWGEFADWYLEIAKLQLLEEGDSTFYTASTLVRVLDLCLRMLHPFIPFVTEEIWGTLKKAVANSPLSSITSDWAEGLIIASWPEPRQLEGWENETISKFTTLQEVIRAIRNIRAEKNVKHGMLIPALLSAGETRALFHQQKKIIAALAQLEPENFQITDVLPPKRENQVSLAIGNVEIYLPLEGLVVTDEERERLMKALAEAQSQVDRLQKLLATSFTEKAPADIVQKERDKLLSYQDTVENTRKQLDALNE